MALPQQLHPIPAHGHHTVFSGTFAFHSFLLSASHTLYAVGQNQFAQCGYDMNDLNEMRHLQNYAQSQLHSTPLSIGNVQGPRLVGDVRLFGGERLSKIVCGDNFSVFLTCNGSLFSCGNNRYGSCGHRITEQSSMYMTATPRRLAISEEGVRIADVNCGGRHVIATERVQNVSRLWCFGQNIFKQLGFGMSSAVNTGVPRVNSFLAAHCPSVHKVICGFSHSLVLSSDGSAWLFGRNHKGQCAQYDADWRYAAQTIETPSRFQDIESHRRFGALDEETLDEDERVQLFARRFSDVRVVDGSGGYEHTVLVTRDNELITFGGNAHRQCQPKVADSIVSPAWLMREDMGLHTNDVIQRVICGIDTTLIVCSTEEPNG